MSTTELINSVIDALFDIRSFTQDKIRNYRCHNISENEFNQIETISRQICDILSNINIDKSLYSRYTNLIALGCCNHQAVQFSEIMNDDLIEVIDDTILNLKNLISNSPETNNSKKKIRIKYVDFYPEFNPKEHWLYKLLEKKYDVEFSDYPDYVFFSCFGRQFLKYNCIRIFISNEAVYPSFNAADYMITYADFSVTDRFLQNRDAFEDLKYRKLATSSEEAINLLHSKTEFCNFVYSNGEGDPFRKALFDALCNYKHVASGGKYLNNIGYRVDDINLFQSKFKFSISCENSFYKGYVTEKIINALNARTIPIYWGAEDISEVINPKAIINCHDYNSIDEIINEVIRLDQDDDAYIQKLQEPILNENFSVERYLLQRENFIYNIIDQPYAKSFRRNTGLRGQWYNDFFCYLFGFPNEWFTPEKGYFIKE